MRKRKTACMAAALALGASSFYLSAQKESPLDMTLWTETDWSAPGSFESSENVETALEPGQMVLAGDSSQMTVFVSPDDPPDPLYLPRRFNCLKAYNGRLYAGYGGPVWAHTHNDPHATCQFAEIWEYDPASGQPMGNALTVYEEGLATMRVIGDRLFVVGPDAIQRWEDGGNLYIRDANGWTVRNHVLNAAHFQDVQLYRGRMYASIERAWNPYPAEVLVSMDDGVTWQVLRSEVLPGFGDPGSRHCAMAVFNDRLFVQPKNSGALQDKILMFADDGTAPPNQRPNGTWTEVPAVGLEAANGIGRFAIHNGNLYLHFHSTLMRFDPAGPRFVPVQSPVQWACGMFPLGFESIGEYLYIGSSEADPQMRFFRTRDPALGWQEVDRGYGQEPRGSYERIKDFTTFRGRLYLSSSNPYDGAEGQYPPFGQGGAIYVAGAYPMGHLVSTRHQFGAPVVEGSILVQGLREGVPGGKRPATDFRFQLRSAQSREGLDLAAFTGPDGTPESYYASGDALAAHHLGADWYQYKAVLESADSRYAPSIDSVSLLVTLSQPGGTKEDQ